MAFLQQLLRVLESISPNGLLGGAILLLYSYVNFRVKSATKRVETETVYVEKTKATYKTQEALSSLVSMLSGKVTALEARIAALEKENAELREQKSWYASALRLSDATSMEKERALIAVNREVSALKESLLVAEKRIANIESRT